MVIEYEDGALLVARYLGTPVAVMIPEYAANLTRHHAVMFTIDAHPYELSKVHGVRRRVPVPPSWPATLFVYHPTRIRPRLRAEQCSATEALTSSSSFGARARFLAERVSRKAAGEAKMKSTMVATALVFVLAAPAFGSTCDHEIVVPIKFQPGKDYWFHKGAGTTFSGTFQKGQSVIIEAAGGTQYPMDGLLHWIAATSDPWNLRVEGPGGFTTNSALHANGEPTGEVLFKIPRTGRYVATVGPCVAGKTSGTVFVQTTS
jgi:hypothetical protein